MGKERFSSFSVSYLQVDLWIGVDFAHACHIDEMSKRTMCCIKELHSTLIEYISYNPIFYSSLAPVIVQENAPSIVHKMVNASRIANVGPMATVAGAFAQHTGRLLKKEFGLDEVVVENGGDIYLNVQNEVVLSVFAGQSPLSEKVGVRIPAAFGELGICTSSGTVGHSLCLGKPDAAVVACRSAILADAYATNVANKIQTPEDIEPVLEKLEAEKEILSAVIICQDKMGIWGEFDPEFLR